MKGIYRIWLLSFVCLLAITTGGHPVMAQESEGLRITPAVIEDKANPGEVYRFSLNVTNIASVEKTFYLAAQDITGFDDQGLPIFSDVEPTDYEMSSWVSLPQESVTLKAGETKEIPFAVQVPASASPGSHFGGIFLDLKPPKLRTSGAGVGIKVGSVISLRIAGEIADEVRLREFSTDKLFYGTPAVTFNARLENLGNVLARPHGFVEMTDMFGKKIETVPMNESGAPVFPGGERSYSTDWKYDGVAFGRYEALLSLSYGDETKKTISGSTSFWVLPLKPIMMALGTVLILSIILHVMVQSYIKKKLREMGVSSTSRGKRSGPSTSRVFFVSVAVALFVVVFLAALFLMFA